MPEYKPCRHETLAQNGVAHVQRCAECGSISLHLGPVTIRLEESTLEGLSGVLRVAATELHVRQLSELRATMPRGTA